MKKILTSLFLLFSFGALAQKVIKSENVTDHSILIVGNNFEGVIFSGNGLSDALFVKGSERFKPDENDITYAEKLLRRGLDTIKAAKYVKIYIKLNLKKYIRQYFGYLNEKGEKILTVNFLWDSIKIKSNQRWLKEGIDVLDGGYHYWRVKINLDKSQFFDFSVNGVA